MITAAEARKQVDEGKTELGEEARKLVDLRVTEAVKKGHTDCWIYGSYPLLKQAKLEATKAGYIVQLTDCQRDGPMLKLIWGV